MSTWLSKGEPRGYHDIDTHLDADGLNGLPRGLLRHHAFQPDLWTEGDHVTITAPDGGKHTGLVAEVSYRTGNILIRLMEDR